VFSRVLYGSRISITAGVVTVLISFLVGILFGGISGYVGGVVDDVMMRFSEMVQSFPPLILAMVIAAALGPNISNSILAMAIIWWPNYARLTRSIVISVKENDYVTASRILGASHLRILYREILPNSVGPMAVMATLDLGNAI
jgi:peptide/nickel transport system permease protein